MTQKNLKENKIKTKCHSSLDGESHQIPAFAGMTQKEKVVGMTRKCESGRSMVEMLGVLAVIGVLSVAGIAGYTIAMRSYRTNEIVNAASMFYVLAKAQNQGNGPTENITYENVGGTNPSGVSTLQYDATDKNITITFNDPNDCTMALNKLGDKASGNCSEKTLTVTLGESTEEDTTDLCASYSFDLDLGCIDSDYNRHSECLMPGGSECSCTGSKFCTHKRDSYCFDGCEYEGYCEESWIGSLEKCSEELSDEDLCEYCRTDENFTVPCLRRAYSCLPW